MGAGLGSGQVTARLDSATSQAANVNYSTATATYTVPAGKAWYVTDVCAITSTTGVGYITLNGTRVLMAELAGSGNTRTWGINACPILTAGQTIQHIRSSGAQYLFSSYVEVTL